MLKVIKNTTSNAKVKSLSLGFEYDSVTNTLSLPKEQDYRLFDTEGNSYVVKGDNPHVNSNVLLLELARYTGFQEDLQITLNGVAHTILLRLEETTDSLFSLKCYKIGGYNNYVLAFKNLTSESVVLSINKSDLKSIGNCINTVDGSLQGLGTIIDSRRAYKRNLTTSYPSALDLSSFSEVPNTRTQDNNFYFYTVGAT
jgi:hypothetical protein